jgi:molybdopterin-containing oxidoreductase family iron-sulfur binding subunit
MTVRRPQISSSDSTANGGGKTARREFLRAASGAAATALLASCEPAQREAFFQKHFLELTAVERKRILRRLEREYRERYGRRVSVTADPPREGVLFAYALDLSRCVGCRRCVYACVKENNLSRDPQVQWIRVLEMDKEKGVDLSEATPYYNPERVPRPGHFYMPVACQQCRRPPCVTVCPVKATWQEPDGVVVVDYNWCIGCRYCMAACPYGARHFNWGAPKIPRNEINPETHYLGNRPRYAGVVGKCTFCIQRVRKGRYPACVEICPVGARKFGNLLDPDSEIRNIIENKRVFIFKEEINTQPKFFYFYGV